MTHQKSITNTGSGSSKYFESTIRSRKSVLKGLPAYIWDHEVLRTDQPYADQRFHIPHNKPPNELNFVGGLGKKSGNARSKLHPNRTTTVQKIFGMRHRNKIAVSFTQPIAETHCCVPAKKTILRRCPESSIKTIVKNVSSADVMASPTSSDGVSDSSDNIKKVKKKPILPARLEDYTINGIQFYYGKNDINTKIKEFFRKNIDEATPYEQIDLQSDTKDEELFRAWALAEREKYKNLISGKIRPDMYDESEKSSTKSIPLTEREKKQSKRFNPNNVIKHISGYMYGPFTKTPTPDKLTKCGDKFGIPSTMIDRAKRYHKKQRIQDNVLRRVRLSHMGFEQPPSKDESSDDNESTQDVKKLALIRTPYFVLPTIRISQVRRKDRFRNKFLKKDRLKRINLLLNGKGRKKDVEVDNEKAIKQKRSMIAKFFKLTNKKKFPELKNDNAKDRYLQLIRDKYLEDRKHEIVDETIKPIAFKDYKERLGDDNDDADEKTTTLNETLALDTKSSARISERAKSLKARLEITTPKELYKRKKNEKLSKYDDLVGPFYIDPYLMDKFRSPKKFKLLRKYYTNLIKSRHWIRDRLQVNAPEFNEEKIGVKNNKYFNRLATEWDEYYIHELRHRPAAKKYCVKTDTMTIREITRNNFINYYIEENLLDLKARQVAETRLMDEVEEFAELCESLFSRWKADAFKCVTEKHETLKNIQTEIKQLKLQKYDAQNDLTKLSRDIFETEERWNFLLKLQNYYYLLQENEWRLNNDWIHRDENGQLDMPLVAVKYCTTRNIRPLTDCSGYSIKEFFEKNIEPNLNRMKAVQPNTELLTKSLDTIKQKTFTQLQQHNRTFWIYKKIYQMFSTIMKEMTDSKEEENEKIKLLVIKNDFILERSNLLKVDTDSVLKIQLLKAVHSPSERKILAICNELYKKMVPIEKMNINMIDNIDSINKFKYIHQYALKLLQKMDEIPLSILKCAEQEAREKRKITMNESKNAMIKQKRFDLLKKQLKNQFTPAATFKRVTIITLPKQKSFIKE